MIREIKIYRYKTQFDGTFEAADGSKTYKGDATTSLDSGSYNGFVLHAPGTPFSYRVHQPRPKSLAGQVCFTLDFDGVADPFKLSYAPTFTVSIEGTGPNTDPYKEMLYGVGPDAYADDPTYIDNVKVGHLDLISGKFTVEPADGGAEVEIDLNVFWAAQRTPSSASSATPTVTMYTYYRDLRTGRIYPNLMDKVSTPNLAAMAADAAAQAQDAILFRQAIDAGLTILAFMQLSIGAMGAIRAAGPGPAPPSVGGKRWGVRAPTAGELGRGMVARLRSLGKRIVVNIGGEGEVADAINLNIQRRLNRPIPNFIQADAADLAEICEPRSVDEIVSNALPPSTLNWNRIIPAAGKVLKPGGRITIRFQGVARDGDVILPMLKKNGFREINVVTLPGGRQVVDTTGALFTAIKG